MQRVLHIMSAADIGGISQVVLNYYRYIDRQRFAFDIALTTDEYGLDGEALKQLGARFFRLPLKSNGLRAYQEALSALLKEQHYDAIHVHENETSYVALSVAKKCGIPIRIAHAHTTAPTGSLLGEIRRLSGCLLNGHYATWLLGCGQLAGDRVFGKWNMQKGNALVLPNAINTEKFTFRPQLRDEMRRKLGCEDKFVIGMVGRLSLEKNHTHALRVVKKLHTMMPDAVLLIVGSGPLEKEVSEEIKQHEMGTYVQMLGRRADVDTLYQAMDAVVMPSVHEGFPVAAVEAMASGLPVVLSSTITGELSFGTGVRYVDLNADECWLEALMLCRDEKADRIVRGREVREHGLDIRDTVKVLESIYLSRKD